MEVEVKIRIQNRSDFDAVRSAIDQTGQFVRTEVQDNWYFDTQDGQLYVGLVDVNEFRTAADGMMVEVLICTATLKGNATLENGISRVEEFCVLGNYHTIRQVLRWQSWTVELDATTYSFGEAFEIEIETDLPEIAKHEIEKLLKAHNIPFGPSLRNKADNLRAGAIL
ncbi:CYTH-like domain-containing protein [Powellomyces hirtus]|nr:CYTH-like domain-containing protein [Powellomyces hirtus]